MLALPEMRPLNQRIARRCTIRPLTCDEVEKHVAFRVRPASGAWETMFTARALDLIYQFSEGVPRKINLICDRSLETGFAALSPTIDETLVAKAAEALELTRAGGGAIGSSRLRPGPRAGRFGVAPGTRRWLATAAGVVAGVGLGAALALMVPWSQRAGPDVAPFLATLLLAQPVDFAAGAAPGAPQSFAIRTVEFATLEPAEATAAMLRELGADAAVTPPDGEVLSYIVWIGSYESRPMRGRWRLLSGGDSASSMLVSSRERCRAAARPELWLPTRLGL